MAKQLTVVLEQREARGGALDGRDIEEAVRAQVWKPLANEVWAVEGRLRLRSVMAKEFFKCAILLRAGRVGV